MNLILALTDPTQSIESMLATDDCFASLLCNACQKPFLLPDGPAQILITVELKTYLGGLYVETVDAGIAGYR